MLGGFSEAELKVGNWMLEINWEHALKGTGKKEWEKQSRGGEESVWESVSEDI